MSSKDQRINDLKAIIPEIAPADTFAAQSHGTVLLDVREPDEVAQGSPKGALRLGRGFLEFNIEQKVSNPDQAIAVMCAAGQRSLFAAESLRQLGYKNVKSVSGGFNRWKSEGLPFEIPPVLDAKARERYSRHLLMPQVGEEGQLKLLNSKVLCIGAGGIGSPVAMYLAAAGVGTIGIVDHDRVDRSNLQRQILHNENTIGKPKVESARTTLLALNPTITVNTYQEHLSKENIDRIFADYDIIVDGSDNIPTRYLVNDACVKLGKANVHGAVFRFEGQVTVFWPGHADHHGPCYRCLFPKPSMVNVPSCSQAGVLGVLPGVVGLLQTVETLKLILNIGRPLIGRMMYYDGLDASVRELKLKQKAGCLCQHPESIVEYEDVALTCGVN